MKKETKKLIRQIAEKMITKKYNIRIWFEKETKLYVIVAAKDGKQLVATQGKTFKEAFAMIGDAIE
ncbi:hypothetical protein ACFL1X_12460, partial [Candidatus Hydrogenedentota bacterium]